MQILSGKEVSTLLKSQLQSTYKAFFAQHGIIPRLATILVGNDSASCSYIRTKTRSCEELGFAHQDYHLDEQIDEESLLDLIRQLNADANVSGILVQLPLPKQINSQRIIAAIHPAKDVDALHPYNLGQLLAGEGSLMPCTPAGIIALLDHYQIPTQGRHVVIIGRSLIVGRSLAASLMQKGRDATVTLCHSRTRDLASYTRQADILISAVGKAHLIGPEMIKEQAVVIDVGINRVPDSTRSRGYRVVGDVDYQAVSPLCQAITPVPGGVGPMTIAMLMVNTFLTCRLQNEESR